MPFNTSRLARLASRTVDAVGENGVVEDVGHRRDVRVVRTDARVPARPVVGPGEEFAGDASDSLVHLYPWTPEQAVPHLRSASAVSRRAVATP